MVMLTRLHCLHVCTHVGRPWCTGSFGCEGKEGARGEYVCARWGACMHACMCVQHVIVVVSMCACCRVDQAHWAPRVYEGRQAPLVQLEREES